VCLSSAERQLFSIAPWRTIEIFHKASITIKQDIPLPDYAVKIAQHTTAYEQFIRDLWETFKADPTESNAREFINAIAVASDDIWAKFVVDILDVRLLSAAQQDLLESKVAEHREYLFFSLLPDLIKAIRQGNLDFSALDHRVIFMYAGALWSLGMIVTVSFDGNDVRDFGDVFAFAGPNDEASCTGPRGCATYANKQFTVAEILLDDIIPGHMRCLTNCRHMLLPTFSPVNEEQTKQIQVKGGPGSGHWAHVGRPNKVGGSMAGIGGLASLGLDHSSSLMKRRIFAAGLSSDRAKLKSDIKAVAKELGYDPKLIKYAGEPWKFEVAGKKYTAGADYNRNTGVIRVYSGALTEKMTGSPKLHRGLMAHEIQHDKWNQFMGKAAAERKEISKRLQQESAQGIHYSKSFMKPDGTFRSAADRKKYKLTRRLESLVNQEFAKGTWSKADGITPYSTSYWERFKSSRKTDDFYNAVNETLAELARIRVTGSSPTSSSKLKAWQSLEKLVNETYENRQ